MTFAALLLALFCVRAFGADWPQYRADAARSGRSPDELPAQPTLLWSRAELAPRPAWPTSKRIAFDAASQPVVARGVVFVGSSVDDKVRALEVATGAERWSRFTGGPVRVAPAVWRDRVFVGSDDGFLRCLRADDGELLWMRRLGPSGATVLGNERVVSRWPVRGGPVVHDDRVYVAAGIWPSEGVFVACLDPRTGDVLWVNDDSGSLYMPQPHGGANARSGIAAQGHLVVAGEVLLVPTGRAVPAAFARSGGELRYFHLQKYGHYGGADVLAVGPWFWSGGVPFDVTSGERRGSPPRGLVAATADGVVHLGASGLAVYRWGERDVVDRKGVETRETALVLSHSPLESTAEAAAGPEPIRTEVPGPTALITCGQVAVLAGNGRIEGLSLRERRRAWSLDVDGRVFGLAAADGRLFVSTDRGLLLCFGASDGRESREVSTRPLRGEPPAAESGDRYASAAVEILEKSEVELGYCVDLGAGDGALALEIARRSPLRVCAVEPDPRLARLARRRLEDAGLYGTRVTVHELPLEGNGFPSSFANLVVSRRALDGEETVVPPAEMERLVRPYGGVVCTGRAGDLIVSRRGELPGAGSWTHQYADPANTSCSGDDIVEGDLELSWYRDVDQPVPQRHGRGPAPLFSDGRLFSEGLDSLVAVDAYNGTMLWEFPLPGILTAYDGDHLMGTSGSGSNFCVAEESVYVRRGGECLRIDAATGALRGRFDAPARTPNEKPRWGYIAAVGEVLFGSVADPEHVVTYRYLKGGDLSGQLTESKSLFALERTTGELLWHRPAEHSFRHNAIAIGGGRVYCIDRPVAVFDRRRESSPGDRQPEGIILALDAATGDVVWKREGAWGTLLALSVEHDALLMSYQNTRFKLASEIGKRMTVLRATSGEPLWERSDLSYASRPLIVGRTVYSQGGAFDLLTGEPQAFNFARSYGCGTLAGSKRMLVYRSATLGYFDLRYNTENRDFGGVRPGCWINALPVGGMVLVPDATSGCACSYLNRSWLGLRPRRDGATTAEGKQRPRK